MRYFSNQPKYRRIKLSKDECEYYLEKERAYESTHWEEAAKCEKGSHNHSYFVRIALIIHKRVKMYENALEWMENENEKFAYIFEDD